MANLFVTDGIALLKFSRAERSALGREYLAFDLSKVWRISVEPTPSKKVLGKKTGPKWWLFSFTGDYQNEDTRALFVGPKRKNCVRVRLLSTDIDSVYLTFDDEFRLYAQLKASQRVPAVA
jgi:hypothetical protein